MGGCGGGLAGAGAGIVNPFFEMSGTGLGLVKLLPSCSRCGVGFPFSDIVSFFNCTTFTAG
jgi:hypothetical protein